MEIVYQQLINLIVNVLKENNRHVEDRLLVDEIFVYLLNHTNSLNLNAALELLAINGYIEMDYGVVNECFGTTCQLTPLARMYVYHLTGDDE